MSKIGNRIISGQGVSAGSEEVAVNTKERQALLKTGQPAADSFSTVTNSIAASELPKSDTQLTPSQSQALQQFFAQPVAVQETALRDDTLEPAIVKAIAKRFASTGARSVYLDPVFSALCTHPSLPPEDVLSLSEALQSPFEPLFKPTGFKSLLAGVRNQRQFRWDSEKQQTAEFIFDLRNYRILDDTGVIIKLARQRNFPMSELPLNVIREAASAESTESEGVGANQNYSPEQFRSLVSLALVRSGPFLVELYTNPKLPKELKAEILEKRPVINIGVSPTIREGDAQISLLRAAFNTTKQTAIDIRVGITENSAPDALSSQPIDSGRQVAAGNPGVERLKQGAVGVAYELIMSDPELSQRAKRMLNGKRELLAVDGLSDTAVRTIGRPGWLALFANPTTRTLALNAINDEATRISDVVKSTMDGLNKGDKFFVPTLVLGTGPQAASFMNELARRKPNVKVLAVDTSERLAGGNFDSLGKMFNLNSREGEDTGDRPLPGTDETLNKVISQVTPSDLGGQRWNPAVSVAISSAVGAYASGADFLLGENVLNVTDGVVSGVQEAQKWPGRYKVVFESGRELYTNDVVIGSGLGTERLPFSDEKSLGLAESERAKVNLDTPNNVPQVVTTGDAFRLAQKAVSPRDPYRGKENVTLVVGAGDSARTFIELLQGLGPQSAYTGEGKDDTAQRGGVGPTLWLTGKDGFASCDEYLAQSRPRYAQLSVALKAPDTNSKPRVEPLRGRLSQIEREGGRIKATYAMYDSAGSEVGTKSVMVDRVVLATGYTDKLGTTLAGVVGPKGDYKGNLEDIIGQPEGFSEPVTVARRLRDQSITFIGAAAGQLPSTKELRGVLENKAALFANTPRTQIAASLFATFAQNSAQAYVASKSGQTVLDTKPPVPVATAAAQGEAGQEARVSVGVNKALALELEHPKAFLAYGIACASQKVALEPNTTVRVFISKEGADLVLRLGAPSALATALQTELSTNSDFLRAARVMAESGKKSKQFVFRTNSKGELTFG